MVLKRRDVADCHVLYDLMIDPAVFPYVRQKAYSYEEFVFLTKQTIELEEQGRLISRTIVDEWQSPIGVITLFDLQNHRGFLGTWIGKPYFGKGYNQLAKNAFFTELFFTHQIETVFMRIRTGNRRSIEAAKKLPYCSLANDLRPDLFQQLNPDGHRYDLFQVERDHYHLHTLRTANTQHEAMEA
ncbi:BH0923 [Halalkalibacterium halodurans C-125]|uniref:BH0923 protein n=1 Tax=Halalkalibacterium halodurans (strain ATCC BAA-125 / DSM 18197 / FERM 7344 / JCM 9153 / C-125) TaxID=272558 RepID=Q9KED0_HALH5|nr:BH0923 [Halalkalibacterium halodurans C-125]